MNTKNETFDSVMPITRFRGTYFFLSNFYPCKVKIDGITYLSAEAAFQAQKTRNRADRMLFSTLSAVEARRYGKKVQLRCDWDEVKVQVMTDVVSKKFLQNPNLLEELIRTGNRPLIESNMWGDTFWGTCRGKGKNRLGKILMKVRSSWKSI